MTIFEAVLVTYSIIHKCIPMGYIWFRQMILFVFKPLLPGNNTIINPSRKSKEM